MAGLGRISREIRRTTGSGSRSTESSRISRGARVGRTGTYVSGKDIDAARTTTALGILRRQVMEEMPDNAERRQLLGDINERMREIETRDAERASRAGRRMEQGTSDRRAARPTLSRMDPDKPDSEYSKGGMAKKKYNKGGMAKKYNKGGYANCGASMKPDGKRRK